MMQATRPGAILEREECYQNLVVYASVHRKLCALKEFCET